MHQILFWCFLLWEENMKNFILNYKDNEGNEKSVELRLTSNVCEQIENQYNCSLIDYVQQGTVKSIITLLMHMRNGAGERFTREMTYSFYDELVDAGYTMLDILDKVIYEALVISGIISQEDLNNIRTEREEIKNMTTEEKIKMVEERKNSQK